MDYVENEENNLMYLKWVCREERNADEQNGGLELCLVVALQHNTGGHGEDSRWNHWNFRHNYTFFLH